eukprot:SAG31_NODE_7375_length_1704_cov_5.230727_1_plen_156_part_00
MNACKSQAVKSDCDEAADAKIASEVSELSKAAELSRAKFQDEMRQEATRAMAAAQIQAEQEQERLGAEVLANVAAVVAATEEAAAANAVLDRERTARQEVEAEATAAAAARIAAEDGLAEARRMVQLTQTRLQTAVEGALLARQALANAQAMHAG